MYISRSLLTQKLSGLPKIVPWPRTSHVQLTIFWSTLWMRKNPGTTSTTIWCLVGNMASTRSSSWVLWTTSIVLRRCSVSQSFSPREIFLSPMPHYRYSGFNVFSLFWLHWVRLQGAQAQWQDTTDSCWVLGEYFSCSAQQWFNPEEVWQAALRRRQAWASSWAWRTLQGKTQEVVG